MEGKKALLFFIFLVLVIDIFWNNALRTIALRNADKPWAKGLVYAK